MANKTGKTGLLSVWERSGADVFLISEPGMVEEKVDAAMIVPEVSEFLRLGESTIYRLAKDGKLPARKVGVCGASPVEA